MLGGGAHVCEGTNGANVEQGAKGASELAERLANRLKGSKARDES
jgi:hypothetical protein